MVTINGLGGVSTHVTVASGKTYEIRDILKRHGFTWCADMRKAWIRDPAIPDEDLQDLLRIVRLVNVKGFDASQVEIKNVRREWV